MHTSSGKEGIRLPEPEKRLRRKGGWGGKRKGAGGKRMWDEPTIHTSIRFPESLYRKLEKKALKNGKSLSYTTIELLKSIEKWIK